MICCTGVAVAFAVVWCWICPSLIWAIGWAALVWCWTWPSLICLIAETPPVVWCWTWPSVICATGVASFLLSFLVNVEVAVSVERAEADSTVTTWIPKVPLKSVLAPDGILAEGDNVE